MPSYMFLALERTANLFPTVNLVHIPFERLLWRFHAKTRGKNNKQNCGYHVSCSMNMSSLMKNKRRKNIEYHCYLTPKTATKHTHKKNAEKRLNKGRQRDAIHMIIRGTYTVRSTDMFDLFFCAATDICALLATLARACATAAYNSRTSSIKCLFGRMNMMCSTSLASILLRRSPMRWASAEKFHSAWQPVASIPWYNQAINARYGYPPET